MVSLLLLVLWVVTFLLLGYDDPSFAIYLFIFIVGILLCSFCVTKIYQKCKPPAAVTHISFWTGYWPSVLIFSACNALGWFLVYWSSEHHWRYSYGEGYSYGDRWNIEFILWFASNVMIHIIFIMRLVQWRKTNDTTTTDSEAMAEHDIPDDDTEVNTNAVSRPAADTVETTNGDANAGTRTNIHGNSNCNGIYCMDLYLLVIGSALPSPIVVVIKRYLYASFASFLALVIFAVIGKCIIDCCRKKDPSNPSTTGDASTKEKKLKYPSDSYSFLAVYSPLEQPNLFCFGLMVFVFQFALLALLITSIMNTSSGNPDDNWFAYFIPPNATQYVRAAQFVAIFAFVTFKDSNLDDITVALELYPRLFNLDSDEKSRLTFSCTLRLLQGMTSVTAVALLVMTSSNVLDIILNFTAVNFVSQLDNIAFDVAMSGKFGPTMESAAKKIEGKYLPKGVGSRSKHRRYMGGIAVISIILLVFIGRVVTWQERGDKWVTHSLKVQFDGERYSKYSGCYNITRRSQNKRQIYRRVGNGALAVELHYCAKEEKWLFLDPEVLRLYTPRSDSRFSRPDPCNVLDDKREIAHSPPTDSFDISDSFEVTWFSSSNIPVVLYFLSTNFLYDEVEGAEPVVCNEIDPNDLQFFTDFSYFDLCKLSLLSIW